MAARKPDPNAPFAEGIVAAMRRRGLIPPAPDPNRPFADAIVDALRKQGKIPDPNVPAPKPVDPFLTPEAIMAATQFLGGLDMQGLQLDRGLRDMETETTYQQGELDRAFTQRSASANDDAAARGVFQSSLRDASLDDLRRTREVQSNLLRDRLETARLDTERQKGNLEQQRLGYGGALTTQSTENAKAVNATTLASAPPAALAPGAQPAAQPAAATRSAQTVSAQPAAQPAAPTQPAQPMQPAQPAENPIVRAAQARVAVKPQRAVRLRPAGY